MADRQMIVFKRNAVTDAFSKIKYYSLYVEH